MKTSFRSTFEYNNIKTYKEYYSNKKNAFKLYDQTSVNSRNAQIIYKIEQRYAVSDKDALFYLLVGMILIYGFVNNIYPQYFQKLFSQFSQSSMRMMQNREQLLNNSVASLLLNLCFILSFSLMAALLIYNRHLLPISFWLVYFYLCLFFTSLYLGKYICFFLYSLYPPFSLPLFISLPLLNICSILLFGVSIFTFSNFLFEINELINKFD